MKKIFLMILIIILVVSCTTQQDLPVDQAPEQELDVEQDAEQQPETEPEPPILESEEDIVDIEDFPEEEQVIPDTDFTTSFKAEKKEDGVHLSWTEYEGEFVSYKVISSVTNANPTYPGESLLKTISYKDVTTYIDTNPEGGISYYAVTALGPLNVKTHSNSVKIEYPDPKETPDQEIQLTAELKEEGVLLEWTEYSGDFLFYKVVTSTEHPFPKYPDDSTIKTIGYIDETSFTDISPDSGINYYAITIIRPDKSRFTSNRVSITVE